VPVPEQLLPAGIELLERGWLSSNNLVCIGRDNTAVVDTGYWSHAGQTLALLQHALGGRPLDLIVNTHLHSDHCGGNAALQAAYPASRTLIPPGEAQGVARWDTQALSYEPTGQQCPRFAWHGLIAPGDLVRLGDCDFEVHAAPGHDPHAVLLFAPQYRLLVSGDALWERGFGIVFPELQGESAFDAAEDTLRLIERLDPRVVVPGHGAAFDTVASALAHARKRLDSYRSDPPRHARHAVKALIKFKLLELRQWPAGDLLIWAQHTRCIADAHRRHFDSAPLQRWLQELVFELQASGAVTMVGEVLHEPSAS
jgi:glyoxylase-like metal-dependent hydrolase (beta-lactamase superfamily II)